MQATTLEGLFSHPSFLLILLTILITIGNILIGVSILPQDKRKKGYRVHRLVYGAVVVSYSMFLLVTHTLVGDAWLNYAVLAYFLIVIPVSRRMNITLHAVLASVGLVLLVAVAAFSVL